MAMAALASICAAAMLTVAVGCKTGAGDGAGGWPTFRYQRCGDTSPCPGGFECRENHCISEDGRFVMTTASCESREQCGYGMACMASACVVDIMECQSDFDCAGDRLCVEGSCVDEPTCINPEIKPCYEFENWDD